MDGVVVLEESPSPRGPIFKSSSLDVKSLSLSLKSLTTTLKMDLCTQ